MNVDGDERLEADGVDLAEIARRLRDEHVEDVEELLVGRRHQLLVEQTVGQRLLRVARPHELQRQQAHLYRQQVNHIHTSLHPESVHLHPVKVKYVHLI